MQVYGLLGQNISYSLSPYMHNAAFKALDIKAEYKVFDIPEAGLKNFFLRIKSREISGCNITIPYKEKAIDFVDKYEDLVKDIGAINTAGFKEGLLYGYNTDYHGFKQALEGNAEGDLGFKPNGKNIFIFGAGGAAKAIIYNLINKSARRVIIADIDSAKAENLAAYIIKNTDSKTETVITVIKDRSKYEEFISKTDLLINATPCGMRKSDPGLFDYRYIHDKLYIFDIVYTTETPLVKEGKYRGKAAISGLNMLLYQATEAFYIWTGKRPPIDIMRKTLLQKVNEIR